MDNMLEVQGSLKLWADGKMSTIELFDKVGIKGTKSARG